jgi:methanol metabolism-related c-type cytochrome
VNTISKTLALALMTCSLAASSAIAEDAKPADAAAPAATPNLDADKEAAAKALLEKSSKEAEFKDGRWRLKDGSPIHHVQKTDAGVEVDWASWQGFRRYHDACHVCHGPNALGSTFAPSLMDSLKTMSYDDFMAVVQGGREAERGGTKYVMPAFGANKDVMCYIDDIYTYIKGRSDGVVPAGRPPGRTDISPEAKKIAAECIGE